MVGSSETWAGYFGSRTFELSRAAAIWPSSCEQEHPAHASPKNLSDDTSIAKTLRKISSDMPARNQSYAWLSGKLFSAGRLASQIAC
jgi:hypothetical protein